MILERSCLASLITAVARRSAPARDNRRRNTIGTKLQRDWEGPLPRLPKRQARSSIDPATEGRNLDAFDNFGSAEAGGPAGDSQEEQREAEILIKAMINAAKADGQIDREEQDQIVQQLGELDQEEIEFLKREFAAPLNLIEFARSVPAELNQQVYAVSLSAIELDTNYEARYLQDLAKYLDLTASACNSIHDYYKAPRIFR